MSNIIPRTTSRITKNKAILSARYKKHVENGFTEIFGQFIENPIGSFSLINPEIMNRFQRKF
jgi:hypothetical protein